MRQQMKRRLLGVLVRTSDPHAHGLLHIELGTGRSTPRTLECCLCSLRLFARPCPLHMRLIFGRGQPRDPGGSVPEAEVLQVPEVGELCVCAVQTCRVSPGPGCCSNHPRVRPYFSHILKSSRAECTLNYHCVPVIAHLRRSCYLCTATKEKIVS